MQTKLPLRLILVLFLEVSAVVLVCALLNLFILPTGEFIGVFDWFLLEGAFCIILSVLLALGRGGIDAYTLRSATTAAATDAIYGTDYQVSQVFRKDKWKPEGFPKVALVLLVAGITMLLMYFLTL